MPFDWFTVAAQIVNFLILVWLMKRFLYRPILTSMDQRERRTREAVETAEKVKAEAERERAEWRSKNAEFGREKQDLIAAAARSAEEERVRLTEAARVEAQDLREKWYVSLTKEQNDFRNAFALRAQHEVIDIARQVLRDLGGEELEERIAQVFISRVKNLDDDERKRLRVMARHSKPGVIVCSATSLRSTTRRQIETVVHEAFGASLPIRFETVESLAAGLELSLDGYKVGWSLDDYLGSMEKSAERLLAAEVTDESSQ